MKVAAVAAEAQAGGWKVRRTRKRVYFERRFKGWNERLTAHVDENGNVERVQRSLTEDLRDGADDVALILRGWVAG